MFTSYFNKTRKNNPLFVAICQYPPAWYSGKVYRDLAPSKEILFQYKGGIITKEGFIELYREECLDNLNPAKVYDELGENAILMCHEKLPDFCHRHIVADWLSKSLCIKIEEL
jgi:uncharacterized protein (DUF488 family)